MYVSSDFSPQIAKLTEWNCLLYSLSYLPFFIFIRTCFCFMHYLFYRFSFHSLVLLSHKAVLISLVIFDHPFVEVMCTFLSQVSCSSNSTVTPSSGSDSLLSPVGSISRPITLTNSSLCSESTTSTVSSLTSNYPKAPGFEREDQVHRTALFRSRKDRNLPI